jgi:Flp pilus assembly protein TadG
MKGKHRIELAQHTSRPRGVTVVESALVLSTLLMILLTMLDMGLAVLQNNSLSEAARWTAREAIVRGEKAPPERTAWGPSTYDGTAADQTEQAAVVRKSLTAFNPADVHVRLEWPDGGNEIDRKVRVTLTYQYEPILPFPFLGNLYRLSAVSTMTITH